MKLPKTTSILLASLLLVPSVAAQEATLESSRQEVEAAKERQKKLQQEERAKALLEKKPVIYGGFLVDAARTEKKSRLFSLRAPRDPKTDYRNISFDERSGKPKGFVLFRLEF
jgi:hypothetical protein